MAEQIGNVVALVVRLFANAITITRDGRVDESIVVKNTPDVFLKTLDSIENIYSAVSYTLHCYLVAPDGEREVPVEELKNLAMQTVADREAERMMAMFDDDGGTNHKMH